MAPNAGEVGPGAGLGAGRAEAGGGGLDGEFAAPAPGAPGGATAPGEGGATPIIVAFIKGF